MASKITTDEILGNSDTIITTTHRFKIAEESWSDGHLILGNYHIWTDDDGRLRIKDETDQTWPEPGPPSYANDGHYFLIDTDIEESYSGYSGYSGLSGYSGRSGYSGATGPVSQLPVGFIFISSIDEDPAVSLGYGSWVEFAVGRFLVGHDITQPEFTPCGKHAGCVKNDLTHDHEADAHTHGFALTTDPVNYSEEPTDFGPVYGAGVKPKSQKIYYNTNHGGGHAKHGGHAEAVVLPPYVVVYMWKRIA